MSDVKVGLVGCGAIGRSLARLLLAQSNRINISGIYDPDSRSVARTKKSTAPGALVCDTLHQLLHQNLDWVMIASWNSEHADQTIKAFESGKHVFCQKPLAINLNDCLSMRDAWRKSGRQFVIGFTLRYSPHYRCIKQLIEEGMIGEIVSLEFNETLPFYHGGYIMGDWRRLAENAGSHLLEKCCHDIDMINWLVNSRVKRVASFGGLNFFLPQNEYHMARLGEDEDGRQAYRQWPGLIGENPFTSNKNIVDNQVVMLEFENQVRGSFHLNSNAGLPERRLYICGSEGTLRADVLTGKIEVKRIGFKSEVEDYSAGVSGLHGGGDVVLASELARAMTNGTNTLAGIEEGLEAATVCFAIDEAMETGKVVEMGS